jgi:hypothetical protein
MTSVLRSARRRPRAGHADLDLRRVENWFVEKGVPQFMSDYLPRDNLRVLLFLLLIVVAFDLAVQPWVGLNTWSLVLAPAALVCFVLAVKVTITDQASRAHGILHVLISGPLREVWGVRGWRKVWQEVLVWRQVLQEASTWRKGGQEVLIRLTILFASVYLLACLIFSLKRSVYWSDSSVDFVVAVGLLWVSATLFRTRPLKADYENSNRISLYIIIVCAVICFAFEGSLFPSSRVLMAGAISNVTSVAVPVPQGLAALAVTVIIVFLSRRLMGGQSGGRETAAQQFDLFFPAVPLLLLVLCVETTVLPYVGSVWFGTVLPLAMMAVIAPSHVLLRRRREPSGLRRRFRWPKRLDVLLNYPGITMFVFLYLVAYPAMVGVHSAAAANQFSIDAFGMPTARRSAFVLALGINLFYLIIAGIIAAFGLDRVAVWATKETWTNWRDRTSNLGRGLPIVLVFTTFLLLTAELWETMAKISTAKYVALIGALLAIAGAFHLFTSMKHLSMRSEFGSWSDVIKAATAERKEYWTSSIRPEPEIAKLISRLKRLPSKHEPRRPLQGLERVNALMVMMTYEILFFFPVMFLAIALFFALGQLVVPPAVAATWVYGDGTPASRGEGLARLPLMEQPWSRVAVLLAAFSVLALAVEILSDSERRSAFFDSADKALRRRLAVRLAYHEVRSDRR